MACWDGYKQVGMKKKGNRSVPNCVPVSEIEEIVENNTCVNCGNIVTETILDENLSTMKGGGSPFLGANFEKLKFGN